ncbi:conserved membrane hypothetical protein [Vibrio jasicida]|jgi:hypothetical protein|uniref:hypothetical protein n=1 Tax=Vibrio harveyi group TaxID=717610 RepID=UPI000971986D|nr:hypothetical protein [Vibrio campbellii]APX09932.1 hypothetical protein BWP24_27350 [Vibrio campbellii]ARR10403.1 hypothetical protein Vc3S01_p30061 [Vibrio campbellii]CAH1537842.1 conserved membrane hypothetical protein [Vibrio jasicida]
MNSNLKIKDLIILPLLSFIGFASIYSYVMLVVGQFFHTPSIIYVDPFYIMSIILGASTLFLSLTALLPIWFVYLCIKQRGVVSVIGTIPNSIFKSVIPFCIIFGGGGAFISNVILLHKVVPENGYELCPKKVGYKKNLLRDYVLDVSQCEKF